jgi:hypothetical protein
MDAREPLMRAKRDEKLTWLSAAGRDEAVGYLVSLPTSRDSNE